MNKDYHNSLQENNDNEYWVKAKTHIDEELRLVSHSWDVSERPD